MLFRVTATNDAVSLDAISITSNLSDYYMVPVAKSDDSGTIQHVAGAYAQSLSIHSVLISI